MAGMKGKVTGVWRLVNREAKGDGLIGHLSATLSQHLAGIEKVTGL